MNKNTNPLHEQEKISLSLSLLYQLTVLAIRTIPFHCDGFTLKGEAAVSWKQGLQKCMSLLDLDHLGQLSKAVTTVLFSSSSLRGKRLDDYFKWNILYRLGFRLREAHGAENGLLKKEWRRKIVLPKGWGKVKPLKQLLFLFVCLHLRGTGRCLYQSWFMFSKICLKHLKRKNEKSLLLTASQPLPMPEGY